MKLRRLVLAGLATVIGLSQAQSSSSSPASATVNNSPQVQPTVTFVETLLQTTIPFAIGTTVTVSGRVRASSIQSGLVFTSTSYVMETYTPTPTSVSSVAIASPTSTEPPSIHLDTKVNGAFAVAGVMLILTGLPMTFWGHKNRWSSIFLVGFYSFALTCIVLIIRFGVLQGVKPPTVKLEGLFLLASGIAGIIGGAISIFFWRGARYFVGGWGGFTFALWVECFQAGGVIKPVGFRWFFYIALAMIGFVACTFPKTHYPTMLISTAIVGSTSFMLGIDCFTTAGLKEFYVWNLGFTSLFPTFSKHDAPIEYPISQIMVIELGLVGAIAVIGAAVQLRFLQVFMQRLKEITQAEAQREREREEKAAQRFTVVERDRLLWEKEHGTWRDSETLAGRRNTEDGKLRSVDLEAGLATPDLKGTPTAATPSLMPALDFGKKATAAELSAGVVPNDPLSDDALTEQDPELREKMKLLAEIRKVKQNIEALREGGVSAGAANGEATPSPTQTVYTGLFGGGGDGSSSGHRAGDRSRTNSRPLSTASMPVDTALLTADAAHANNANAPTSPTRPPRAAKPDPRNRTRSDGSYRRMSGIDMLDKEDPLNLSKTLKVPQDPAQMHWDEYTRDRTLFTPPTGITAPIPASEYVVPASPAVQDALERRMAREAALEEGPGTGGGLMRLMSPFVGGRAASPGVDGANRHSIVFPKDAVISPAPAQSVRYPQVSGVRSPRPEDLNHSRQPSGSTVNRPNVIVVPNPPKQQQRKMSYNKKPSDAKTTESPITPPPRVVTAGELDERHRQRMRALQRPITEREAEQAKLDEAKARWENSRRIERTVMERKEKEQRRSNETQQQVVGDEEELPPRRSTGPRSGAGHKVAEWQKRQSVPPPPRPQISPVVPRFSNDASVRSRPGSMEVASPQQAGLDRPPVMPAGRHSDRRMSSRSLDTWNMFSSPGSAMKPPPN